MGYPPYVPPITADGFWLCRGRRAFLRDVPGPDSRRAWKRVDVEMEVLPYKHKWEWRIRLLMDGRPDPGVPENRGWRRTRGSELRGRCRNQGDAWVKVRRLANDVRAINAAVEVVNMRRHQERLPL